MHLDTILMLLSTFLICSFFYNYLLDKFQIPSVILLITTGVILKIISNLVYGHSIGTPEKSLAVFGTLGLITIVLEAVLDLKISKSNYKTVAIAGISAAVIVIITITSIALVIYLAYPMSFITGLIYATPLSIVSSAIVIPSVAKLTPINKDFLVLESIFSDIIGILAFNFLTMVEFNNLHTLGTFTLSLFSILILSAIVSIPLALIINHNKRNHQHIFILAILVFMYSLAKHFNLSALILILVFGLLLNNIPLLFSKSRFKKLFDHQSLIYELNQMQGLTSEFAFIIRTFFFILFGYSINLKLLLDFKALLLGLIITIVIYLVRYLGFKLFRTKNIYLNSLVGPRGLITVLLFYQIPHKLVFEPFDEGIIFVVVILSSLVMGSKLIYDNHKNKKLQDDINH